MLTILKNKNIYDLQKKFKVLKVFFFFAELCNRIYKKYKKKYVNFLKNNNINYLVSSYYKYDFYYKTQFPFILQMKTGLCFK